METWQRRTEVPSLICLKFKAQVKTERAVIQAEQDTVVKDASLILYKYPVTDLVH